MTDRRHRVVLVLAALAACKPGDSQGNADDGACVGAKCDDVDNLDEGPLGKLDVPGVRADLGVAPSATCDASCAVLSGCLGAAQADCLLECDQLQSDAAMQSAACEMAADGLLECIAGLDCEAAAAYQAGTEGYPCEAQEQLLVGECSATEPAPQCEGFCALAAGCTDAETLACATACADALASAESVSDACGVAQADLFDCVAALPDCTAFEAWTAASDGHPCADADDALAAACTTSEEG